MYVTDLLQKACHNREWDFQLLRWVRRTNPRKIIKPRSLNAAQTDDICPITRALTQDPNLNLICLLMVLMLMMLIVSLSAAKLQTQTPADLLLLVINDMFIHAGLCSRRLENLANIWEYAIDQSTACAVCAMSVSM